MADVGSGVPDAREPGSPATPLQRQPSPPWASEPLVPSPVAVPRQTTWCRVLSTLGPFTSHQSQLTVLFMKSNQPLVFSITSLLFSARSDGCVE